MKNRKGKRAFFLVPQESWKTMIWSRVQGEKTDKTSMKYFLSALLIGTIGFFWGRGVPFPQEKSSNKEVTAQKPLPLSDSGQLIHDMKKAQRQQAEFESARNATNIDSAMIHSLMKTTQDQNISIVLRRRAALALRNHLTLDQWKELLQAWDARLKESLSLSSSELSQAYINASQ